MAAPTNEGCPHSLPPLPNLPASEESIDRTFYNSVSCIVTILKEIFCREDLIFFSFWSCSQVSNEKYVALGNNIS